MDAGLVVVLAVLGVFLLVPLVFAWLSTNPRRWSRVEGVLGREPRASERAARWAIGCLFAVGPAYIVIGIVQARTDEPDGTPWLSFFLGAVGLVNGATQYVVYRRRRAESLQTQVQRRAEPGRPGPGG
jgi:hypothetical protein